MTSIEWTDETWNPVTGCDRCSPGCDNCYALTLARRLKAMGSAHYQTDGDPDTPGPGFGVQCHEDALEIPLRWKRPRMVFVNSMSDLFHPDVPTEFIAAVFAVMARTPQHTYQVLTKRPGRMQQLLDSPTFRCTMHAVLGRQVGVDPAEFAPYETPEDLRRLGRAIADAREAAGLDRYFTAWPLPNVWLGTTIESNRYVWRADRLRDTPAAVRFISAEPLLDELTDLNLTGIDWLIVGGESGPGARPMHPNWARGLRDQCMTPELNDAWPGDRHTAFFFKQWGDWVPYEADPQPPFWDSQHGDMIDGHHLPADLTTSPGPVHGWWADVHEHLDPVVYRRVGKKAAGRRLDGVTWDEYPKAVTAA